MLGVGDDCALLPLDAGMQLATSTDLFIEGRHFLSETDPVALGHKALAVNLSDLAAMGAQPLACLLSLSLPDVDHAWLQGFSDGFYALADASGCSLVGGDTTRSNGGIVISVTVMGQVRADQALRRSAAQPDDRIWLTGMLGAPDIALRLLQGRMVADETLLASVRPALERPMPPWHFGQLLAGVAHAALDVSDGLVQDLGHILTASQCGANLFYASLPADPLLAQLDLSLQRDAVLSGGDVYQLCFTAAVDRSQQILQLAHQGGVRVTPIGCITREPGLRIFQPDGRLIQSPASGYDHFA